MATSTYRNRLRMTLPVCLALLALMAATALGASGTPTPDWFERQASLGPRAVVVDARSPDTRDVALAQSAPAPDWLERHAAGQRSIEVLDARSPDTRDAALTSGAAPIAPQTVAVAAATGATSGFDWQDASVGALFALAVLLLAATSVGLVTRAHRRQRVEAA